LKGQYQIAPSERNDLCGRYLLQDEFLPTAKRKSCLIPIELLLMKNKNRLFGLGNVDQPFGIE